MRKSELNAKRILLLVVSFSAFSLPMIRATAQSAHDASPAQAPAKLAGPKKAEEQFKNIQVLKGKPGPFRDVQSYAPQAAGSRAALSRLREREGCVI